MCQSRIAGPQDICAFLPGVFAVLPIAFSGAVWYNGVSGEFRDQTERKNRMETRVAVIAIIVQDSSSAVSINALLHDYDKYIIGRMGVPYRCKGISIINIAIDAPQDAINRLAGAIGRLPGVSAKTVYAPAAGNET